MKRPDLSIQARVRTQTKSVKESADALRREIETSGAFDRPARVRGGCGVIRVIIRAKAKFPEGWSMAVLLNNVRIDGIDWELRVRDHRGPAFNCTGWHRHVWKNGSADHKQCLPKFKPTSLEKFILDGFAILKVKLGRKVSNGQLLFDSSGTD